MKRSTASAVAGLGMAVLSLCAGVRAAEPDVPGSRDPFGIDRFPRSWVVAYQRSEDLLPRELITSRVDRVSRELRVEDPVQVTASKESVTYRIPDGASVSDVLAHYRREIGGDLLFSCAGRACGRSADWAHQVYGEAVLYGPDANQRYLALEWQGLLVSLYVNERGNKRVYAHLEVLDAEGDRATRPNVLLVQRLGERGWAVVESVTPDVDGGLDEGGRRHLAEAGSRLDAFTGNTLYLVCHLDGDTDVQDLLTASRSCASQAVGVLEDGADEGEAGDGPRLVPFGAGPLLPRPGQPGSRIELVMPGFPRSGP